MPVRNEANVPSRQQHCPVHGMTEFRRYTTGTNAQYSWYCMACKRDHNKAVRTGEIQVVRRNTTHTRRPDECKHSFQRDPDNDEDWCEAWRCAKCGTTAINVPGDDL